MLKCEFALVDFLLEQLLLQGYLRETIVFRLKQGILLLLPKNLVYGLYAHLS